jgi:hypothetical protein
VELKKNLVKRKGLFDHIKHITSVQSSNYWDTITDEDKKTWSNYMVHRFLSMRTDFLDVVNEIQMYNLSPEIIYKFYSDIIPKGKYWLKYIKGRKQMDYPRWLLDVVAKELEVSLREAVDAVDMYMLTEGGQVELTELLQSYGVDRKKLKEVGLQSDTWLSEIKEDE